MHGTDTKAIVPVTDGNVGGAGGVASQGTGVEVIGRVKRGRPIVATSTVVLRTVVLARSGQEDGVAVLPRHLQPLYIIQRSPFPCTLV